MPYPALLTISNPSNTEAKLFCAIKVKYIITDALAPYITKA